MISHLRPHARSLVDIVDERNQPLGYSTDIHMATKRGLWFRAVHMVLYTPDGHVLVEQRTHRMMFYPDHLDITLSGIVDTSETPEAAAIRELDEEVGLAARSSKLQLISINKYNHRWPTLKRNTRNVMYHYLIEMPSAETPLQLQTSEVADARWLSLAEAKKLVRRHYVPGFGHLETKYAMYEHLLNAVSSRVKPA